jgi:apolipoprotein N-acyltransferase
MYITWAETQKKHQLLLGTGASAISGILIVASMPNFDMFFLAWFALVPMFLAIEIMPDERMDTLTLPFGIIWSIAVHNWYLVMFGTILGYILMFAVGGWYALLIRWDVKLQRRMSGFLKLLALPVLWTAIEFIKYIAPVLVVCVAR